MRLIKLSQWLDFKRQPQTLLLVLYRICIYSPPLPHPLSFICCLQINILSSHLIVNFYLSSVEWEGEWVGGDRERQRISQIVQMSTKSSVMTLFRHLINSAIWKIFQSSTCQQAKPKWGMWSRRSVADCRLTTAELYVPRELIITLRLIWSRKQYTPVVVSFSPFLSNCHILFPQHTLLHKVLFILPQTQHHPPAD